MTADTSASRETRVSVLLAGLSDGLDRGVSAMLAGADGFIVNSSRLTPDSLRTRLKRGRADVVVLGDLYARSPRLVEELHVLSPGLGVVLIADELPVATRLRLLSMGTTGCLPTCARESEVIGAVRLASEGSSMHVLSHTDRLRLRAPSAPLTRQERAVIAHMRRGMPNSEIAAQLGISVNTVRSHVKNIYAKLEIKRRAELFALNLPDLPR